MAACCTDPCSGSRRILTGTVDTVTGSVFICLVFPEHHTRFYCLILPLHGANRGSSSQYIIINKYVTYRWSNTVRLHLICPMTIVCQRVPRRASALLDPRVIPIIRLFAHFSDAHLQARCIVLICRVNWAYRARTYYIIIAACPSQSIQTQVLSPAIHCRSRWIQSLCIRVNDWV